MSAINIWFHVLQQGTSDNNFLPLSPSGGAVGEALLLRDTENKLLERKVK